MSRRACVPGTGGDAGHSREAFEGGRKPFMRWMDGHIVRHAGPNEAMPHPGRILMIWSFAYAHARPCSPRARWSEGPILVFDRRRVGAKWDEEAFGIRQAGCADGAEAHCEGTARVGDREENETGMTRRLGLRPSTFRKIGCAPRLLLRTGCGLVKLWLTSWLRSELHHERDRHNTQNETRKLN